MSEKAGTTMASTVRLWHRILVDHIAESRWLRARSGKDAAWLHYERHARAAAAAAARHARAAATARNRAADWSARGTAMHERLSQHGPANHGPANHGPANHGAANHGPARILPRWQATVGRLLSAQRSDERQGK
jgi:hypothetical protein